MEFISFQLKGRVAHFLKAEAGVSALSYPAPPRTVILGLLGAVLGLPKDEPQVKLEPANIAVSGKLPRTFWHKAKFRREDPDYLPSIIQKKKKLSLKGKVSRPTLIRQEWLFEPDFTIWVSLPEPYHAEIAERLRRRRWHFQPCLGLSEMMADLIYIDKCAATPLQDGVHRIYTIFPQKWGLPDTNALFEEGVALNATRLPRSVTADRIFSHEDYFLERDARPVPVQTSNAFQWRDKALICL